MALIVCPRCDTLLKVFKISETFFCPCGVELEHPNKNTFSSVYSDESKSNSESLQRPPAPSTSPPRPRTPSNSASMYPTLSPQRDYNLQTRSSNSLQPSSTSFSLDTMNTQQEDDPNHSQPNQPALLRSQSARETTFNTRSSSDDSNNASSEVLTTDETDSKIKRTKTDISTTGRYRESKCCYCEVKFTLFGKRKRTCRSCLRVVCSNCSKSRWPSGMLPKELNPRNEKSVRVCTKCQIDSENFRAALLDGDLPLAKHIYNLSRLIIPEIDTPGLDLGSTQDEQNGVGASSLSNEARLEQQSRLKKEDRGVRLYFPYLVYPERRFPIHCAAESGNEDMLKWLLTKRCNPKVTDAKKRTVLSICAEKGYFGCVKILIYGGWSEITEITDVTILQKVLRTSFIHLQRFDIRENLTKSVQKISNGTKEETIVEPRNELEEEEQLQFALKKSEREISGIDDSPPEDPEENTGAGDEECVVCFDAIVDCVIVPCGHMSCCETCAKKFEECPVCRQKVENVIKTFRA
eukprot:maker-scaffold_8-snap-gene-13.51-mRNA-1 protein AED:0.00 eAED:0.00 QI:112/1/1/1/1/1/2/94/520